MLKLIGSLSLIHFTGYFDTAIRFTRVQRKLYQSLLLINKRSGSGL